MSAISGTTEPADRVLIEMWTDLGCPWCYLGKHRLDRAIREHPHSDRFTLRLRSFELNPNAPLQPETIREAFIRAHGGDASAVLEGERRIQQLAQDEGLPFSLERRNANSFTIHRVMQHARTRGKEVGYFALLQDGFFAGDLDPYAEQTLVDVAVRAGLDADEVRTVIRGDLHADDVRRDVEEGRSLGVRGVPFVVYDRRFATSGAQSVQTYRDMLDRVLSPTTAPA